MAQEQQNQAAQLFQATSRLVNQYYQNPSMFTDDETKQIYAAAKSLGIPFEAKFSGNRAVKKGLYELGEGLSFGLLPNSLDPGAMNTGEELAGMAGGLAGLVAPGYVGLKVGRGAARMAEGIAGGKGLGFSAVSHEGAILDRVSGAAKRMFERGTAAPEIDAATSKIAEGLRAYAKKNVQLNPTTSLSKWINGLSNKKAKSILTNLAMGAERASLKPGVQAMAGRMGAARIPFTNQNILPWATGLVAGNTANRFFDEQPVDESMMQEQPY